MAYYNKFLLEQSQRHSQLVYKELEGIDILSTYYAYNWQSVENIKDLVTHDVTYIPNTNPELEKEFQKLLQLIIVNSTWIKVGVLYNANEKIVAKSFIYIPNLTELSEEETAWVDNIQAISSFYEEYLSKLYVEKGYSSLIKKVNYELELDTVNTEFKCVIGSFTTLIENILCTKKIKSGVALKSLPIRTSINSETIDQHICICCNKAISVIEPKEIELIDKKIANSAITEKLHYSNFYDAYTRKYFTNDSATIVPTYFEDYSTEKKVIPFSKSGFPLGTPSKQKSFFSEANLVTIGKYKDEYVCNDCKLTSVIYNDDIFTKFDNIIYVPEIRLSSGTFTDVPVFKNDAYILHDGTILYKYDIRAEDNENVYIRLLYNGTIASEEIHNILYSESSDVYFIEGDPNFWYSEYEEDYIYNPESPSLSSAEFIELREAITTYTSRHFEPPV